MSMGAVKVRTKISIHALREESDRADRSDCRVCGISIHALREESDTANNGAVP